MTAALALLIPHITAAALHVVVVEGLGGDDAYTSQFAEQVAAIEAASATVTDAERIKLFLADSVSREAVLAHLAELGDSTDANDQIAVYLIGHGSYDDHEYKFNIAGPDLTDADLADALSRIKSTNQLLVNTSSASGAIAENLSDDNRLVVLATRSGVERHATRFGSYFAAALNDPSADINKNQLISVAEAYDFADRQVVDYFERNDRLATEHARIEGSRADRFGLSRLTARRQNVADSQLESLIEDRNTLNAEIDALRLARDNMTADEYQAELLQKMLRLAVTEDGIESREAELGLRERGQ